MDAHKNFAYSIVATAPSPASSGTSLVVSTGDGSKFPTGSFNATVWPANTQPTTANAEIVRCTVSGDTFTITRAQEGSSARTIIVGDQIAATITAKTFTDIETAFDLVGAAAAAQAASQPLDATLTAFAALTIAANKLIYGTGADAFALADFTAFARTLLDDTDAATMRTTLGLGAVAVLAAIAEANLSFTDVTTANATSSQHGLLPKLDGSATKSLLGDGTWGLAPLYATNVQTGSYTLVLGDAGKIVEMNVGSANNLTVPPNSSVAFPVGTVVSVHQYGAGQTTVLAGAGVTIDSPSSKVKLTGQFSSAAIRKRATNEWVLAGDLTA